MFPIMVAPKIISTNMRAWQEETTACQEEMEADAEKMEPDSEMMQSVVEHQEVPIQDATVMPVREPEEEMTSITRKDTKACQEMEPRLYIHTRIYISLTS
jgi:hypothetical protein